MNGEQFLQQDTREAVLEYRATWACIDRISESLMNGDLHEAKLSINDLTKSIRELEKLQTRKQRHDELVSVIHQLADRGLLVKIGVGR